MKIVIIGNAGSGKSTFAQHVQKISDLPLYHLDQYFWQPGWKEPDRAVFEKIHNELCDQDAWIIEGMATRFLAYRIAQADVVVFLDTPTRICLYRVLKRAYTYWGKQHFAAAKDCPERLPNYTFLTFIMQFNRQRRPIIMQLLEQYKTSKIIYVAKHAYDQQKILQEIAHQLDRSKQT